MTFDPSYYNPLDVAFKRGACRLRNGERISSSRLLHPDGGHPEYFIDGVHPNATGYTVMEAALSAVVEQ